MSEEKPTLERQTSESLKIPERRVVVKDASELPTSYSTTPGGTMFSTTPGGTRIIYDRRFLLQMRNSPLSKSPPPKLATIPDILNENIAGTPPHKTKSPEPAKPNNHNRAEAPGESELFPMDC